MLPAYQPGETMIIEIQGNILEPIGPSDIIFKRAHVAIAVDYDVKRILDKYYLYAQVPTNSNNYTLFINSISTTVNGQPQTIDYNQTFQVTGNLTDYSISPGFIITDNDFYLTIKSNLDQQTTININFPSEGTATLNPGMNELRFATSSLQSGFYLASIGKYIVPIRLIKQSNTSSAKALIEAYPRLVRETLKSDTKKYYNISITNKGNSNSNNLYFTYDKNLFNLSAETIEEIAPNSSTNLIINLKKLNGELFNTIFIASGSEILGNITFEIFFTNNESEVTNSSKPEYYCSELAGKFCSATEVCSTQPIQSLDGSCCLGECRIKEDSTSSSWIFYTLVIVVLVIIVILYLRYKKTKLPRAKNLPISSLMKKTP